MNNDVTLKVGFDIDKFTSELNKTNSLLSKFGADVQGHLLKAFTIDRGIQLFTRGVSEAVESVARFGHQMQTVKAITDATDTELTALKNNALNLAGAFKSVDIARLETEFGRLGFYTKEILQSTKATIDLATATGEDLAKSTMIAGSTLRAFNLDASKMGHVTDVMAAGFNKSALSLNDFGEAIKYVAPVAASAGISLEQVTAMLGVLADAGIKGSMAGTSLRKIISDLGNGAAPILSQKLAEMAREGMSSAAAMDEVGRTAYASLLVLSKHVEKIDEATEAYKNANGETARMAAIMKDDLLGDWQQFNVALDQTIQKGTLINNTGRGVTQFLTELVHTLTGNDIGMAIDHIKQEVEALDLLHNASYTKEQKASIFTRLEEDAKRAGVQLSVFMKDYELIKNSLFGALGTNPFSSFSGQFGPGNVGYLPEGKQPKGPLSPAEMQAIGKKQADADPYSHAKAIAASAGRTYGDTTVMPDNTAGMASLKGWSALNAQVTLTGSSLDAVQESLNGIKKQADAATMKNLNAGWKAEEKNATNFASHMKNIGASLRNEFARIGVGISDALAGAINGTQSFVDAMGQLIPQVISQLENLAIAYIIAAGAKEAGEVGYLGPGAVIAAIAGIVVGAGLIKSMFSGLGSHGSSSVSSGSMQSARVGDYTMAPQSIQINGTLKASGSDMAYTFDKQGYRVSRVGG